MPSNTKPETPQAVLQRITQELTAFIADEMQRRVMNALHTGVKMAPPSRPQLKLVGNLRGQSAVAESAIAEKKSAREPREAAVIETKPAAKVALSRTERTPSKESRALDMTCRVEGCSNRSRGPRMGFICDLHRAQLTPDEQLRARENYKARPKASASPSTAPSTIATAPVDAEPSPVPVAVVAPIAQSADPVKLPEGVGPAPAGTDYALTIDRARLVASNKLGPTVELRFTVAQGPQFGRVARGRFPLSGRGLAVLIEAALGESVNLSDSNALDRLVGRNLVADVVSAGNPDGSLAIVRNIRPSPR